jgi:hypothetical protein
MQMGVIKLLYFFHAFHEARKLFKLVHWLQAAFTGTFIWIDFRCRT